jgi:hypothetical protein
MNGKEANLGRKIDVLRPFADVDARGEGVLAATR